jgi:hypothetical protein
VAGADGGRPAAARRPRGKLPRWLAIVLLVVPCLLTLPVAGYGVLIGLYLAVSACFDTCGNYIGLDNSSSGVGAVIVAELIAGIAALAILVTGLVLPRHRRAVGIAGWIVFLLSCTGLGLLAWSPS